MPTLPPVEAPYSTIVTESVLNESFSSLGNWMQYDQDGLFMGVVDDSFHIESNWRGKYVWSSNYQTYGNTIMELDVNWLSDDVHSMVGVMCHGQSNGTGYYVLVSYTGQFSIRRDGLNRDEALREWQTHPNIPSGGEAMKMRVVCIDNYIGLYINGKYVDGATDNHFKKGIIALVAGLSANAGNNDKVAVAFDNLRVWNAELK